LIIRQFRTAPIDPSGAGAGKAAEQEIDGG
jgi:hypothetical protein